MIRWLIPALAALAIGGLLASNLAKDPGYILIQIAGYTLESSLLGLILLVVIALGLISLGTRLITSTVKLPGQVGHFVQDRRLQAARKQLHAGLKQLSAGQFDKAEIELLRRVSDSENPASHYLLAADAAHQQGHQARRDEYLELADQSADADHFAVLLKRAQLWAQDERHVDALAALEEFLSKFPRHAVALALKLELLSREQRWDELRKSLPQARNVLSKEQVLGFSRDTHIALLSQARASGRVDELRAGWQDVPAALKHDVELIEHYAHLCQALNIDADALRLIVGELRHHWHARLALLYGELDGGDVVRQLAKAEEWIKQYGEKAELLLIAGRLCLRNRLWGRARSYFEACLRSYPSPEIRLELGKLLMAQGEDEAAALQLFREGLETSLGKAVEDQAKRGELMPPETPA